MTARKPTALVMLEGERGHRTKAEKSRRVNEPHPRPVLPDAPPYLSPIARTRWDELLPELDYTGVLTRVDGDVFAGYCMAYADICELTADIEANGRRYEVGTNGAQSARPEVAMLNRAKDDLRKFGAELGIGAASRSKIEIRKSDDSKNTLEEIVAANARR